MRGARRLYFVHVGLAGLGAALLAASAAFVLGRQTFAIPSSVAISEACANWLNLGGAAALLGLAIAALGLATIALGLRSVHRQARASRVYLASHSIVQEPVEVGGQGCLLISSEEPLAFCAGYFRPRVYLSSGALKQLDRAELHAVVAHEAHHLRRRDPLRLLAARALADALFFMPILRRISERYSALGELEADEAAVTALCGPGPIASAMLKFSRSSPRPALVVSVAPERVDHLLGDEGAARWRIPRSQIGPSGAAIGGLAVLTILIGLGILQPSLQLPLLLGAGCMIGMYLLPVTLALAALAFSQRAIRTRRA